MPASSLLSAVFGALALLLAHSGFAATLEVGPGPRADFATVQAAVDALPATGGTLKIAPGVYREKLTIAKPAIKLLGTGKRPQ
ncbi:MAG TPA: hypothetical protein VFS58_11905, partial [Steroidobacteraceae bacterium]|nr:hypothetical protein [Steroidobacteraceae bacterium]